jgi:hypothetical protein
MKTSLTGFDVIAAGLGFVVNVGLIENDSQGRASV